MADNINVTPGSGAIISSDDIGGVLYQRIKLIHGADGVNDGDVSNANPFPTKITDGTRTVSVRDTGSSDSLNVAIVDASGNHITSFGGGTQYAEDAALGATPTGTLSMARRTDTLGTLTPVVDDAVSMRTNNRGALWVAHDGTLTVAIAAGTNNIGDVDVLSVPAPLNVTGGGVEASALRVTIANDSTGVLSVDDNGGSLTVDGTVAATQSGTWNVTNVSGTVSLPTGASTAANQSTIITAVQLLDNVVNTDGAAYGGSVSVAGYIYDEIAGTALDENDAAAARINANRAVVGVIEDGATRTRYATVTASNALKVDGSAVTQPVSGTVTANAGSGTFTVADNQTITDNAAFTDGTSKVLMAGYVLDETAGTALTENDAGAARMDSKRAQVISLEDGFVRGRKAVVDASGNLSVNIGSSAYIKAWSAHKQSSTVNLDLTNINDVETHGIGNGAEAYGTTYIHVWGTWTGSLKAQLSGDGGTLFNDVPVVNAATGELQSTITANGQYWLSVSGASTVRMAVNATGTGTANLLFGSSSANGGLTQVAGIVQAKQSTASNLKAQVQVIDSTGDSAMDDANNALRVNVVAGGAGDGAILDGVSSGIKATVLDYTNSNPLAVRLTDTNGDYVSSGAGTQYTEDAAAAADPIGNAVILVRKDTPATIVSTDGDNVAQRGTNYGAAYVQVVTSSGSFVDSFGGGTQYTEDVAAAADPVGNMLMLRRRDTPTVSEVSTDGDNIAAIATSKGELRTRDADSITELQDINSYTSTLAATVAGDGNSLPFGVGVLGYDGSSARRLSTTTSGQLITVGSLVDNAAFTDGTTRVDPVGFIYDEVAGTALTENDIGAARINVNRAQIGVIEDGTTRARYATVTASNALKVDGSAVTQPVSGTVTANLAAGTNNIGDVDVLTVPAPLNVTGGGVEASALRVTIANDSTGVISVDDNGSSLTVDGTVTANAGTGNFSTNIAQVAGGTVTTVATGTQKVGISDSAGTAFLSAANALNSTGGGILASQMVAQFDDTTPTSITENQFGNVRMSANRNLYATIRDAAGNERGLNIDASGRIAVTVASMASLVAGTAMIGSVAGPDAHDAAVSQNPLVIAGRGSDAIPTATSTDGDVTRLWVDKRGAVKTAIVDDAGDSAMDGTNNALRVNVVAGGAGDGAILDGVSSGIKATVLDYTNSNPLAVRLTDTNGDYVSGGGGTEYTEDAAAAADPIGKATILVRKDTPAAITSTDGDNIAQRGTNYGAAYVQIVNSSGAYVDSFGGGTQYTEGDVDASITGTALMWEDSSDTLAAARRDNGAPVSLQRRSATGSITGTTQTVTLELKGDNTAVMIPTGTFSGVQMYPEGSFDGGTTWVDVRHRLGWSVTSTTTGATTITANQAMEIQATGMTHVRVRCTAYTSGTANITLQSTPESTNLVQVVGIQSSANLTVTQSTAANLKVEPLGNVAHDAADSGNPVKVGAKAQSALPTAVASVDRTDLIADLFGRLLTGHIAPEMALHANKNYTTQQTGTDVITPTSGKKLAITSVIIGTYGTTAGRIILWFGDNADTTFTQDTDQVLCAASFAPSTTSKPGLVFTPMTPVVCTTANRELHVTTDAAISFDLTIEYYEF